MIDIIYDHPDFVVVNKPINLSVQDEKHQTGILPHLCAQLGCNKLWLVHRLDKVTSGLLILGKHSQAASEFGQLFEQKSIQKYYLALCSKKPKKKQGVVIGDMKKIRDGKWALTPDKQSPAVTQFFNYGVTPGQRLSLLKPHTGKTHQLRVMQKSLGSPILGDTAYGGAANDRVYLHAYGLKFNYQDKCILLKCAPTEGQCFLSQDFTQKLDEIGLPWEVEWPALTKVNR